jgi:hypothetical protein
VLKITAYKEILRLLAQMPTDINIQLIMHEWNRKELHRDVNIAIIRTAFSTKILVSILILLRFAMLFSHF